MSRASTPTAPAPAAPTQAATPAAAAPAKPYEHKIIMPDRTPSGTSEGQRPNTLAAKSAQVREAARSQFVASDDDDQDDGDEPQTRQAPKSTSTTPPGQAATPAKPDDTEAAPELSAREKNAARIREALKAQTAAREAEQARRAAQTQPAQPPATQQQQQSSTRFWAEVRRHPNGVVAGLKEQGWTDKEIHAFFDDATNDAIAPGTVRGQVQVEEQAEAMKRERERLDAVVQHIKQREHESYVDYEKRQFQTIAQAKEGDEHLFPESAAMDPEELYELAEWRAGVLSRKGIAYDLESLALDTEEWLAKRKPKTPDSSPASTPAPTTTPAAKTKHTRAALPPDLAGESGTKPTKPLSLDARSAAIRRSAAKMLRAADR